MPRVVREQPVRSAGNSGEENGNVRLVSNQMPTGSDERLIWVRDHFRIRELDQPAILLNEIIGLQGWKALGVKEQILFHFIPDNFCKHKPAQPRRAKRESGFVEPPWGDNTASEDIRIEEEPNSPAAGHFNAERVSGGVKSSWTNPISCSVVQRRDYAPQAVSREPLPVRAPRQRELG